MMETKSISNIIDTVLRAVGLAMAVAVVVLNILGVLSLEGQVLLLGIGLFCVAVSWLNQK